MSQENPSPSATPESPSPSTSPPPPSSSAGPTATIEALAPGAEFSDEATQAPVETPTIKKKPRAYSRVLAAARAILRKLEGEADAADIARIVKVLELEAHDLLVQWNVTMTTADGRSLRIKGSSTMPDIFAAHVLPRAVNSFETTVANGIVDPLLSRFQSLLQSRLPSDSEESRIPLNLPGGSMQAARRVEPPPRPAAPARPANLPTAG